MKSLQNIIILSFLVFSACGITDQKQLSVDDLDRLDTYAFFFVLALLMISYVVVYVVKIIMRKQREKRAIASFDHAILVYYQIQNDFGGLARLYYDTACIESNRRMLDDIQSKISEVNDLVKFMHENITDKPDSALITYKEFLLKVKLIQDQVKLAKYVMKHPN
ncbi:MAG: hypothetical protein WCJ45_00130 [bacterium]